MKILDSMYEEALGIILENYDGNVEHHIRLEYNVFPQYMNSSFKKIFSELEYSGYLASHLSSLSNASFTLTKEGIEYFKNKEEFLNEQSHQKETSNQTFNINTLNANGSNFVLGNVFDSSFNIDNSIHQIEKQIEENGDTEKEELKQLLKEAKEIISKIKSTRSIPQNKRFFEKLSGPLEKHGWFYGAIVGLLGQAGLSLLGL